MKKALFILTLVTCFAVTTKSQVSLDRAKQTVTTTNSTTTKAVAPQSGLDVNSATTSVMSKLTSSLALKEIQKPKVLSAVTDFFKDKSGITGLLATDKAQYTKKLSGLTSALMTKLKGILSSSQYKKLLDMKPSKANAKNVLSQLFY